MWKPLALALCCATCKVTPPPCSVRAACPAGESCWLGACREVALWEHAQRTVVPAKELLWVASGSAAPLGGAPAVVQLGSEGADALVVTFEMPDVEADRLLDAWLVLERAPLATGPAFVQELRLVPARDEEVDRQARSDSIPPVDDAVAVRIMARTGDADPLRFPLRSLAVRWLATPSKTRTLVLTGEVRKGGGVSLRLRGTGIPSPRIELYLR